MLLGRAAEREGARVPSSPFPPGLAKIRKIAGKAVRGEQNLFRVYSHNLSFPVMLGFFPPSTLW